MKYMGMLDGEPKLRKLKVNPEQVRLQAKHGGIWRQKVDAGQRVEEGEVLGEVVDLFGETLQVVNSPFDGVANNSRTSHVVNTGDTLLSVIKV
jgi:hypothetical protein